MEVVSRTDVGKVRSVNEDSIATLLLEEKGGLFAVVADGMGGHKAGDVASQMLVQVVKQQVEDNVERLVTEQQEVLKEAVFKANADIFQLATDNPDYQGMGTTVIATLADEHKLSLVHAGDSRCYLLHSDDLVQLTDDHSYVNVLLKHGQITEEEAKVHPRRNMIVNAVGTCEGLDVDCIEVEWAANDILCLCSDGLTNEVDDVALSAILSAENSLEEKSDLLMQLALENGGRDNISFILVKNSREEV